MKRGGPDALEALTAALVLAAALINAPGLRAGLWAGIARSCQASAAVLGRIGIHAEAQRDRLAFEPA